MSKIDVGYVWDDCKERFVTNIGSTTGLDGVRCKYIILDIKPQGWVASRDYKTDEERLIYLVPLHSHGYNTNNHTVWHDMNNCCIGTTAFKWIREFEANEDGRYMWMVLLQQHEVTNL